MLVLPLPRTIHSDSMSGEKEIREPYYDGDFGLG